MRLSGSLKQVQGKNLRAADARMQVLAQIVDGIKAVKYWAWEENFFEKITGARDQEATHLSRYRTLQVCRMTYAI